MRWTEQTVVRAPGVMAAAVVMLVAFWIADVVGRLAFAPSGTGAATPISGVGVAILLGLALGNLLPLPDHLAPGLTWSTTSVLRLGIVLVGIRLSLVEVVRLGLAGVPVVLAAVATGLIVVPWLARQLGLPPRLGALLAAGTSICGVTAVVATAPALDADEREVSLAVATIVAFGLLGMLTYPMVLQAWSWPPEVVGLVFGVAVHDTSQVVGAALLYAQSTGDEVVLQVATVTKLTRNLLLVAVVPLLAWQYGRSHDGGVGEVRRARVSWTTYVPGFIVGFVGMAAVRSAGDAMLDAGMPALGLWEAEAWQWVTRQVGSVVGAELLLGTAMAAVGLNTRLSMLRGPGLRPFAAGLAGAAAVAAVGLAAALLLV